MLTTAVDQVPVIPFGEVVLKLGTEPPVQIVTGVTLKLGVMLLVIVTLNVTGAAHCPAFGVNT